MKNEDRILSQISRLDERIFCLKERICATIDVSELKKLEKSKGKLDKQRIKLFKSLNGEKNEQIRYENTEQ